MVNEDFREEVNEGHKEGEEREVVEGLVADVDGAQAADHRGQQRPDAERPRLQPVHCAQRGGNHGNSCCQIPRICGRDL